VAINQIRSTPALAGLFCLSVLACGGGEPPQQEVAPAAPQASAMAGEGQLPPGHPPTGGPGLVRSQPSTGVAGAASSAPQWEVPATWQSETPASRMRQAQYRVPATAGDGSDGECAVFYFGPGQGGDVQGNIMRWASQFSTAGGGPPAPEVSTLEAGGQTVTRVEVSGAYTPSPMSMSGAPGGGPQPDYRLFGAIIPGPDAHWFIKCTGPEKTMEANRDAFDGMLSSVRYGG
jgi:hypothetical protein